MPLPPGWIADAGLPLPSGRRSLRFFKTAAATANFADSAYNFAVPGSGSGTDASLQVPPSVKVEAGDERGSGSPASGTVSTPMGGQRDVAPASQAAPVTTQAAYAIRICNDGAGALEYSFNGTDVHGLIKANEQPVYLQRYEPGIAVRGVAGATPTFRIEAW